MKIVFFVEKSNYGKARDILLKDELVSKQSINFKDHTSLGLQEEGYYVTIDGSEESLEKAREVLKDLGKELNEEQRDKILELIKRQEDSANQGFGNIFG